MRLPGRDDLPGVVALVLAGGVSGFVLVTGIGILIHREPLSEGTTNLLATVLGGMVGAVGTFLGVVVRRQSSSRHDSASSYDDDPTSDA